MDAHRLREQVDQLLSAKKADEAERLLVENKETAQNDGVLYKIYFLVPVCSMEREAGQKTLFSKVSGLDELLERDTQVKFWLRRIVFDVLDDEEEFFRFCAVNRVSMAELMIEAYCNAVHKEKAAAYIKKKIGEGKLAV